MKCLNCGEEISEGKKFCKYCGAPVKMQTVRDYSTVKKCKKCGSPIKQGYQFCDQCGTPVEEEEESGSSKKAGKIIIIIVLSIVVLAGLGVLVYLLLGKQSDGTSGNGYQNTEKEDISSEITSKPKTDEEKTDSDDTTDPSSEEVDIDPVAIENTVKIDANIPSDAVTFEGHSYCIFDNGCESWNEAKDYCESRGGYLAVINTPEENEFLYEYMLDNGFDEVFFGYTDQDQEGVWTWVSGKNSDYTDWGINEEGSVEPNSSNDFEDYAHMNSSMHDGYWNDKKYGQKTTCYFCEWDVISLLEEKYTGKVVTDDALLKNNALDEADTLLKLDKDEEISVLYSLTKDKGEVWYYVQYKTGIIGYIRAESLEVN